MKKRSKLRIEGGNNGGRNGGARNSGSGNGGARSGGNGSGGARSGARSGGARSGGIDPDKGTVSEPLQSLSSTAGLGETLSLEMLQQVWARRAEQFAAVPVDEDEGERLDLTIVRLGRELYGLEAHYVFRIRPATQITRVPRVPDWVMGVANERGRILSVVDLYRFFGFTRTAADSSAPAQQHLVVVETPEMELALFADEVLDIESVPLTELREVTEAIRGIPQEYVRGVLDQKTTVLHNGEGDALIIVLDLPALLADARLVIHEEII
jgi:purine-binding chemotaxis protein CheW